MGLEVFDNYECDGQMELPDCTGERQLTHLSLFSGIGGLDLAAEWAGFQSVGQCEWAPYPRKILEERWPDVPKWKDIRTLTGGSFYEKTNRRTVNVISGGFPCQPFSTAGKQRGKEDDRYLWPEMVRVIKDIRPTWVVGENVAGIINMALDTVLSDLEAAGYAVRTFIIPACGVDAPHQRYRTAIVAYTDSVGRFHRRFEDHTAEKWESAQPESGECSKNGSNTDRARCKEFNITGFTDQQGFRGGNGNEGKACHAESQGLQNRIQKPLGEWQRGSERSDWWSIEPGVGRVANGVPNRVDRIKCLGNAVVPAQFYPIFQAIADIELGR